MPYTIVQFQNSDNLSSGSRISLISEPGTSSSRKIFSLRNLVILIILLLILVNIVLIGLYIYKSKWRHKKKEYIDLLNEERLLRSEILKAEKLYLNEKYLRLVKLANLRVDSKSIVDRATKRPLNEVLNDLEKLNESNLTEINLFINKNLHEPGIEIIKANYTDWSEKPKFLESLRKEKLVLFAKSLNKIWLDLYKRFDFSKLENGSVSSHLPMKYPFIVPGGRFLEIYYWDTYWVMEGLLVCGMFETAQQLIENFIYFIEKFGFIPNGSRIYYLNRSQPPYFTQMISIYYEYSMNSTQLSIFQKYKIKKFILDKALNYMIKEYNFWMTKKSIELNFSNKKYKLNIYKAHTNKPRPESYFEDIKTARFCHTEEERAKIYTDIISATESGYDFSSRWFNDSLNLCTIQTTDIVPIDLNSLMYSNEIIISKFCLLKSDFACSKRFTRYSLNRKFLINNFMWSNEKNSWSDYNHINKELNRNFFISDLTPLFMGINPPGLKRNLDLFKEHLGFLDKYRGGVPVSLIKSNQQWDFPNIWAPNQHMIVNFLIKHDRNLALRFAKKFFDSVYTGWKEVGVIFEKYDGIMLGERGTGGEYEPQSGFGWTNGVILSFINIFKDDLIL